MGQEQGQELHYHKQARNTFITREHAVTLCVCVSRVNEFSTLRCILSGWQKVLALKREIQEKLDAIGDSWYLASWA